MKQPKTNLVIFMLIFLVLFCTEKTPAAEDELPNDLTELSIEELADLEVTSVSKKPQKISRSAAAIFVITGEDIRRSGVTSIPEALRMVPGLNVAKIDANKWAVSSRGFNGTYANKLLVLIDGRTIYSSFYSGVLWSSDDTLLEDIDRIEVIRGPGASLWGANAVNGIINIITKHTRDTKGGLISTGFGTEERGFINARYGDGIGDKGAYRIYAKAFGRDESADINGTPTGDDWYKLQAGFRTDQSLSDRNDITLQGDIYQAESYENSTFPSYDPPFFSDTHTTQNPLSGGNILGRWQHRLSHQSDLVLQIYYDSTELTGSELSWQADTLDTDFQHTFSFGHRQEIIWGMGYRYSKDNFQPSTSISLDPKSQTHHLFNLFVQDEITIIKNHLLLTLGSKTEHNSDTGYENQPNARILWTPDDSHTFWAAVSRATRSPSRVENDMETLLAVIPPLTDLNPTPYPTALIFLGNENAESENLVAHEIGYRVQTNFHLMFDITAFYNLYDDLINSMPKQISFESSLMRIIAPFEIRNLMEGETRGYEISAKWKPTDTLRLQAAYTYLDVDLKLKKGAPLDTNLENHNSSPNHQFAFGTSMNLPWNLESDIWLRYVDDILDGNVESYTTTDVRLSWEPVNTLCVTLVGQNLLEQHHLEFIERTGRVPHTEMERSVYAGIIWKF